ncbi:TonB-dependent siderophore receptor [Rhodoferax sp. PAMC 29310]|uniref:TonB-dependent receptor n=1 Tax=Rhodoferax sp. PAMC 29310 TaxID=2822760 RepID=UPI001B336697|nr:TonB-dependent siderophore receptor [Rhodoferax sp. PAMC 29310]
MILPLGAALLAGSMSALAQQVDTNAAATLKPVIVKEKAEASEGKDALRATTTGIGKGKGKGKGKGNQALRDIPQSVTVVTEKLVDDRNLDTLKDVLHNTAGVTFQAAEGGEEDIRLRGFSLATSGDIFVDGLRDPAFYDRDTFNNDRIELLRGSASILFGRGSTGGAVNQVSKQPRAIDEHEVSTTLGSHNFRRVTGDFNIKTGEDAALHINAMATKADNNGAGSSIDKKGIAATYRFGIGTADEFSLGLYHLDNNNGMNYGLPWIKPTSSAAAAATTINNNLDPSAYYGLASDRNAGEVTYLTASHTHRFQDDSELKTTVRRGSYDRDQRAVTIRNANGTGLDNFSDRTVLNRSSRIKIQDLNSLYLQSEYSTKLMALGLKHEILAGVDFADEVKNVYRASGTTSQRSTLAGTPNDGVSFDEGSRVLSLSSAFHAKNMGAYLQDMMYLTPEWKVLAGLRYDTMDGAYDTISTTGAISSYQQKISNWSKRFGVLYQPNDLTSYHFSYGTSFNTSADTYSYSALSANTDPEQSRNIEFGAKLDTADKRFTTRLALFHSTKFNERNTDPDSAATAMLLSGKRHTVGFEIDITGRLTNEWEVYGSYMWMPTANIDVAAATATAGERTGERPSLTPVHTGTVWSTYQLTPQLRLGAGVNFRSEQAPNRNPGWLAPDYATVDVMGEYKFNDRYTLKANVSNVANKLYADSLYTGHYVPGSGRNAQLTLNVKF